MTNTIRGGALLAVVVGSAVVWILAQTVQRAQDSNALVTRSQEVLGAAETMLSHFVDADAAVRVYTPSAGTETLALLEAAERSAPVDLDRIGALTSDNPAQQARLLELRSRVLGTLSALRVVADAKNTGRPIADAEAAAAKSLDDARAMVRDMRAEENRLLGERARGNQDAVRRLQWLSVALGITAAGLGVWVFRLNTRRARRVLKHADELGRANERLETELGAHAASLRSSNARLRSIIDSAVDGIIVIDGRGQIESFNRGAERLFGYPESEVVGRNVSVLMPSPDHEAHDGYLSKYLETGAAKIIGYGREVTGRRRDGTAFPLHLSVGEISIDGERKFTGMLHDLSDRVRLEAQLREQTSLARIGEMAAVIAHEVKNPLAGIRGAIQVIGSRLPEASTDGAVIGEIVARIDALNDLMQDLLLFARPPQPRPTQLDISRVIQATAELFNSDPSARHVEVTVAGTTPPIIADGELLKIVFVNLLINAGHAMQGRGTITVTLRTTDDACVVSVADEGPGMPADVLKRIFVPFFTTKARGSGLGLSTARRLIDAHNGRIDVVCPPGGGTVVTVELPAAAAATVH